MKSITLKTKRRCYWRTDIEAAGRPVGILISTPQGFVLHTQDTRLRWLRRRFYRSPADLLIQWSRVE